MSDFNRFISYKSKFQLLKHEIAEKILQAETQSAALEESLRINQVAKAKRRRGGGSAGSKDEGDLRVTEDDDNDDDHDNERRKSDGASPVAENGAGLDAAAPSPRRDTPTGNNENAIADMLAACESAGGYSDL